MKRKFPIEPALFINVRVLLIVSAVLILGMMYFYFEGYRLGEGLKVARAGTLRIEVPIEKTRIFINEKLKTTTEEGGEVLLYKRLTPGSYSLIASRDGYWPWAKNIDVVPEKTTHAKPFLTPSDASGVIITSADRDFNKIEERIEQNFLPEKNRLRVSRDGKVGIYAEGNTIRATWLEDRDSIPYFFCTKEDGCLPDIEILRSTENLRNLDFYKERSDVVIYSAGVGIYAIEIDKDGTQNFQPIYKGAEPFFARNGDTSLYVKDKETLMELVY